MKLKVFKLRPDAKLPRRAYPTDCGADLFYCPLPDKEQKQFPPTDDLKIYACMSALVPTGLKIEIPEGYMLEVKNKSGVASKKGLLVGACVCDPYYSDEVFVNLHNVGGIAQTLVPGQKIAQVVLVPIVTCDFEEVKEERDLYKNVDMNNKRALGGFGSTGQF